MTTLAKHNRRIRALARMQERNLDRLDPPQRYHALETQKMFEERKRKYAEFLDKLREENKRIERERERLRTLIANFTPCVNGTGLIANHPRHSSGSRGMV